VFDEESLLPLSALQHLIFCERQAVLIHVEQQWADNPLTVEGTHLHRRADETGPRVESRGAVRSVRRLALHSLRLGLVGRADVVEFHRREAPGATRDTGSEPRATTHLPGIDGWWLPFPVEYKRGRPKADLSDRVQLCAQALCLEEMLEVAVPAGALFYGQQKRRLEVAFDDDLRRATEQAAARMHALFRSGERPFAKREPKCRGCSLVEICMPDAISGTRSARQYLHRMLHSPNEET
jgi:CRISPR-associated exonuclease Cas4